MALIHKAIVWKRYIQNWQGGSAGDGACQQAWRPEFESLRPARVEGENRLLWLSNDHHARTLAVHLMCTTSVVIARLLWRRVGKELREGGEGRQSQLRTSPPAVFYTCLSWAPTPTCPVNFHAGPQWLAACLSPSVLKGWDHFLVDHQIPQMFYFSLK